jgi:hypothetical protein
MQETDKDETARLITEFFAKGGMVTRVENRGKPRPKLQLFKSERIYTINF